MYSHKPLLKTCDRNWINELGQQFTLALQVVKKIVINIILNYLFSKLLPKLALTWSKSGFYMNQVYTHLS